MNPSMNQQQQEQQQTTSGDGEFQSRMRQLDQMLQEVDAIPDPAARAKTAQIIQGIMDFHGAALSSVMSRLAREGAAGDAIVVDLANDDLAANLLLLYGLHPHDLATRVRAALEKVRPYLASHGGNVELLDVSDEGAVRLAMQGSCHGCPSSAITLKTTIEQAIYERAPDVIAIHVQDDSGSTIASPAQAASPHPARGGFVPVEQLVASATARHQVREGAIA